MLLRQLPEATSSLTAVLFILLYSVWLAGEVLILVRSLFQTGQRRDSGSFFGIFLSIALALLVARASSRFPRAAMHHGHDVVFTIGLVLMAAGVLLRFTSVLVLGRFFSPVVMVTDDQQVVEAGPYRWVRHPSYSGLLLAILGLLLAYTSWVALLGLLPALAAVLYRIHVEERTLIEELGDQYQAYLGRTKRLVPFVY